MTYNHEYLKLSFHNTGFLPNLSLIEPAKGVAINVQNAWMEMTRPENELVDFNCCNTKSVRNGTGILNAIWKRARVRHIKICMFLKYSRLEDNIQFELFK